MIQDTAGGSIATVWRRASAVIRCINALSIASGFTLMLCR